MLDPTIDQHAVLVNGEDDFPDPSEKSAEEKEENVIQDKVGGGIVWNCSFVFISSHCVY